MPPSANRPLQIVIADMPALLGDLLVKVLDGDPGLELMARVQTEGELEQALAPYQADFVLLGLEPGGRPDGCTEFFERRRAPQLVGINTRDGSAAIHRLRPEQTEMSEISPPMLPSVLRDCWVSGSEPV